jgi:aspartyl aminopeptidase
MKAKTAVRLFGGKMDYNIYANGLINYIDSSPCAAFAQAEAIKLLRQNGFAEYEGSTERGGRYYISRGGTALAAFICGDDNVRIGCAHLDSPAFMIKPRCEIVSEGAYVRLNTELYGGAILSTWLDRPLGLAGMVMLKSGELLPEVRLYNSNRPVCIIPNCAPHLNKEINNGFVYNKQRDMLPLFSLDKRATLVDMLAEDLGVAKADVLDYELYCYDVTGGMLINDMLSVGRLDDLMMAYALVRAICDTDTKHTSIVILTDNEEVGSLTMGGARGSFPLDVMRCVLGDNYRAKIENTVALSADLAHAVNPAQPQLHEPLSRPYLNGGMVLKRAANKSYSTDGVSGAVFKAVCERAGVKYQDFVNPSDKAGGTTIGPMLSAALGIPTADIGAPVMAMHSVRELGGVRDAGDSYLIFKTYFEM